ncbi:MAG: TIGR03943 family putative permease subunit, partial [bacterium]
MPRLEIPVYLFLGFLDSGKTRFIQETMEDPRFDSGKKTLLLVCEEGEEEFQPEKFGFGGVSIRYLEDKSELNPEKLEALRKETGAGRVVMEYNGMWQVNELLAALPETWVIYQVLMSADGTTALTYARDNNMRSLFLDKIGPSELVVFNRAEQVDSEEAKQELHKLVRQVSRKCDIAYEYADGSVQYDDIPDPLPFDVNAPIIEIGDEDYGIWFLDAQNEPEKYDRKTVRFLAQVYRTPKAGIRSFVPGRFAMTCCAADIQFVGFPCVYDGF